MWALSLPDADDQLRQGDLLVDVPYPKRGRVELSPDGLSAPVKSSTVVVLDHCCTIEQQRAVTLARVISTAPLDDDSTFRRAIHNNEPTEGRPYAQYVHLLAEHPALPVEDHKFKVIDLVDTVNLIFPNLAAMRWLAEKRVARMSLVGRAQLRHKLAVFAGRAEPDDRVALRELGLDGFGRPRGVVHHLSIEDL